jgi:hypothetical protein
MRIVADRHLNLHSPSTQGGLVFVPQKEATVVPEDVREHPAFNLLVKNGHVSVLKPNSNDPVALEEEPEEKPEEEEPKEDSEEEEPEEKKSEEE